MTEAARERDDLPAVALDLAVVAAATWGRGTDPLQAALPFAAAALVAHVVLGWRHQSTRSLLAGLAVWVMTLLGGLAGRFLLGDSGGDVTIAVILAAGMMLWRLAILARSRMRSRRPTP